MLSSIAIIIIGVKIPSTVVIGLGIAGVILKLIFTVVKIIQKLL